MTSHQPRHSCSCCENECWPMWATLHNKPYCMNCFGIGCDTKPAECRRPLLDRITEKVADAIKQSAD